MEQYKFLVTAQSTYIAAKQLLIFKIEKKIFKINLVMKRKGLKKG